MVGSGQVIRTIRVVTRQQSSGLFQNQLGFLYPILTVKLCNHSVNLTEPGVHHSLCPFQPRFLLLEAGTISDCILATNRRMESGNLSVESPFRDRILPDDFFQTTHNAFRVIGRYRDPFSSRAHMTHQLLLRSYRHVTAHHNPSSPETLDCRKNSSHVLQKDTLP